MDMANKLAYTDLPTAIRRINDNQTLQRFFTENTTDKLDVGEKESEDGNAFVGYIGIRGTDNYINLSKDDLAAARIITGLPSTSKTLLSPLAKAERPTAEAPATRAERFPVKDAPPKPTEAPAPTPPPAKELSLAQQISSLSEDKRKASRPVSRGAEKTQIRKGLEKELNDLRDALYRVNKKGEIISLKPNRDPNNPVVKKGIERLKEIEKQLSSL
jgi:hypothetical protein